MSLRAVIFDFDGLILDTEFSQFEAWNDVFQEHGATLDLETWARNKGPTPNDEAVTRLEGLLGRKLDREVVISRFQAVEKPRASGLQVLSGILERLAEAKDLGLQSAIASSSSHAWVEGHLDSRNLRRHFDVIHARKEGVARKPAPDVYLQTLETLGIAASEALAFEDSEIGITSAKRAGLFCVAVPNAITRFQNLSGADRRVASLVDFRLCDIMLRF